MRSWFGSKGLGRRALVGSALGAAALSRPLRALAAPLPGLTKLTFSLDFIPLGRHAPWYAAIGAGYFRQAGLDVTIIPAQGTAQALQSVASGVAELGLADLPGLAIARGAGAKDPDRDRQLSEIALCRLQPFAGCRGHPHQAARRAEARLGRRQLHPQASRRPDDGEGARSQEARDRGHCALGARQHAADPPDPGDRVLRHVGAGPEGGRRHRSRRARHLPPRRPRARSLLARHRRDGQLHRRQPGSRKALCPRRPPRMATRSRRSREGGSLPEAIRPDAEREGHRRRDRDRARPRRHAGDEEERPRLVRSGSDQSNIDFVAKYIGIPGTVPKASDLYAAGFLPTPPILP